MNHLLNRLLQIGIFVTIIFTFISCDKNHDESKPISINNGKVDIEKSKEHFSVRSSANISDFEIDPINWGDLNPVWNSAHEVILNDLSTVVIVPIADSAITMERLLDAYVVFFSDSLDSIQMHLLFFQADSTTYSNGSLPVLESYYGYIWEFYDKEDTYSLVKVENGFMTDCGCSTEFSDYISSIDSLSIVTRGIPDHCPRWKNGIIDLISTWFSGAFTGFTKALFNFFSGGTSGTGWGGIGFVPGGPRPGIGIDLGIGGNGGGGGGSVSINLADYFNEWELKKILKITNWMNSTYNTNITQAELVMMLGEECMWAASDFINNIGPTIDDETYGPDCVIQAFLEEKGGFDIDDQYLPNVNSCEKELILLYPGCAMQFYLNRKIAEDMTELNFGINGLNDCSDAFRHAFYNAINTVSCGKQTAKLFGDAHECDTPLNRSSEKAMDLHNNSIGQQIGMTFSSGSSVGDISDAVCARLALGDMMILEDPEDGSSDLIDSDNCECE